jgi:hypothetical protein
MSHHAAQPEVKNAGTGNNLKQAAAGAGGAVAGAAGAILSMGFVVPEKAPDIPDTSSSVDAPVGALPAADSFDAQRVPMATGVNDHMSFSEAFAVARAETGAGGVFFWKGGVYGTYYRNEWNQLSPEYREAFSNYPYQQPENAQADSVQTQEDPAVTPTDGSSEAGQENATANPPAENTPASDPAQPADVEVLGIQYAEVDGHTVAVAPVSVNGSEALLVDVDTDGIFDYALTDSGTETPDVHDISEYQITCDDVNAMQQAAPQPQEVSQEAYLNENNLPDYTNNASVDQFTTV